MRAKVIEAARTDQELALQELVELVAIPSISALPEYAADTRRAGQWVASRLEALGMRVELRDVAGQRHPVVYAEWLERPGRPVVGIYGHYDVQPADPIELWNSEPFRPEVRGGNLYGRGASDMKGNLLAAIRAAASWFEVAGGPPVNLRFFVEGEEESGGRSLGQFLAAERDRLHVDYLVSVDGGFLAPGLPMVVTGLRGMLYTEIEVQGGAADLHSGIYGGVAPNPLNTLCHIVSGLKDRDGHITIPGFYDAVREPSEVELASWRKLPITESRVLAEIGAPALEGEPQRSPVERMGSRPTLDCHGIVGGFTGAGAKTVIPSRAVAKVSMRLVPDQDPAQVLEALRAYVATLRTPGTSVEVRELSSAVPLVVDISHPGIAATARAFEAAGFPAPVPVRTGGSIPVIADFRNALDPHLVLIGFGLPDDNLHSPNEKMAVSQYLAGIETLAHLLDEFAGLPPR